MRPPASTIEYGPTTIVEFDAREMDPLRRYELIDGVVIASSRPAILHQDVMAELAFALFRALPTGYRVVNEVEVEFPDDTKQCCIPDLVVTPPGTDRSRQRFRGYDLSLAIEIISGTGRRDRVQKRAIYAAGGIPVYWMVELEPFRILVNRLAGHWYQEAEVVTGDELVVTDPFEAKIDLREVGRAARGAV